MTPSPTAIYSNTVVDQEAKNRMDETLSNCSSQLHEILYIVDKDCLFLR